LRGVVEADLWKFRHSEILSLRQRPPARLCDPHPRAALAGDDPKTIVLDLVQPLAAGRQFCGFE
jgi:hypothetical protein